MTWNIVLAIALVTGDAATEDTSTIAALDAAVNAPELAPNAELSFLVQKWERGADLYQQMVDANPTIGFNWWRLASCRLETGQYAEAIAAFSKSEELGGFQWGPPRMVYHGESAWGLAAAHARLGHKEEAIRWTRTALSEGLRDIRRFHGKHFSTLMEDPEYRKLVWAVDVKNLSRDEGFQHDLRFLMHEAKRIHFAPFRATPEAALDARASALEAEILSLSDEQIFVRMRRLVRGFGDGHTTLRSGRQAQLPLTFFQFPEGLYVDRALAPHADLLGAKLLRIGDKSADEALALTEEITSRDNSMTVRSNAPLLLSMMIVLRGLEIVTGNGPVALEIEDVHGKTRRVELDVLEKPTKGMAWVNAVPGCDKPVPRSLASREKMYWFEDLPDERAVYCQINGIGNMQESFADFCERLFAAVERPEIDSLIVDLRFNGGGDTFQNVPLIEGIIRSDKLRQPGRLFVVIGRATFSAAQNTTSELERRTKAILVGEPTGSRPNFIGESLNIPLPYCGWNLSVSDLWWQHSMSMDYRIWTPPHLYAPPTAKAFREHKDPSLELIARYRARAVEAAKK
jgi:hypothetical protein